MSGSKELFAGVFSRHAEAYRARHDEIRRQGGSAGRARLLELLAAQPGERVLDLCCGPGNLTLELGPGLRLVGIDLAAGMLRLAAAAVDAPLVLGDAEALPFVDAAFDAVACGHGLQFCPDLGAALREVRRVLRAGGRLAASLPGHDAGADPAGEIIDALLPPFPATPDRASTLAAVADPGSLERAALEAGFTDVRAEAIPGSTSWESPREMFVQAFAWWAGATRLEGLDGARRGELLEQAVAMFVARHGDGPVEVPGADLVLYACA